ncbi:MAG: hemin uptake protein HemP [Rhodocyclaceae bacterium]|nr:hemin uptake protein HemP [Rhodocyclaceae bacterium]
MKTMVMRTAAQSQPGSPATTLTAAGSGSRVMNSGVLFAGCGEIIIAHGPELYRLRLTRQNRLILTK